MKVDVFAVPGELDDVDLSGAKVVVVDVIRATTTVLAGLEAGARRVVAAASIEEAVRLAGSTEWSGALLCGERGGRRIDGFDLGNSPGEFRPQTVEGKTLVCTTTNGTRILRRCRPAGEVSLGCFRNRRALTDRLVASIGAEPGRHAAPGVAIACAGKEGRLGLEDLLCAGLIVEVLEESVPDITPSDGARAALAVAAAIGAPTPDFLSTTAAGVALVRIGLERDLAFCAEVDVSRCVPVLRDGGFVLAERIETAASLVEAGSD